MVVFVEFVVRCGDRGAKEYGVVNKEALNFIPDHVLPPKIEDVICTVTSIVEKFHELLVRRCRLQPTRERSAGPLAL